MNNKEKIISSILSFEVVELKENVYKAADFKPSEYTSLPPTYLSLPSLQLRFQNYDLLFTQCQIWLQQMIGVLQAQRVQLIKQDYKVCLQNCFLQWEKRKSWARCEQLRVVLGEPYEMRLLNLQIHQDYNQEFLKLIQISIFQIDLDATCAHFEFSQMPSFTLASLQLRLRCDFLSFGASSLRSAGVRGERVEGWLCLVNEQTRLQMDELEVEWVRELPELSYQLKVKEFIAGIRLFQEQYKLQIKNLKCSGQNWEAAYLSLLQDHSPLFLSQELFCFRQQLTFNNNQLTLQRLDLLSLFCQMPLNLKQLRLGFTVVDFKEPSLKLIFKELEMKVQEGLISHVSLTDSSLVNCGQKKSEVVRFQNLYNRDPQLNFAIDEYIMHPFGNSRISIRKLGFLKILAQNTFFCPRFDLTSFISTRYKIICKDSCYPVIAGKANGQRLIIVGSMNIGSAGSSQYKSIQVWHLGIQKEEQPRLLRSMYDVKNAGFMRLLVSQRGLINRSEQLCVLASLQSQIYLHSSTLSWLLQIKSQIEIQSKNAETWLHLSESDHFVMSLSNNELGPCRERSYQPLYDHTLSQTSFSLIKRGDKIVIERKGDTDRKDVLKSWLQQRVSTNLIVRGDTQSFIIAPHEEKA